MRPPRAGSTCPGTCFPNTPRCKRACMRSSTLPPPRAPPRRAGPRTCADGNARVHATGRQRGAAPVSARMAVGAPYRRGGRAGRLSGPAGRQRAAAVVPAASSPALLEGPGSLLARAFRPRARGRAAALRLPALRRRPAPLHRRDLRSLRDAHAPVQGRAPLSPQLRARQAPRARGADQPAHPLSAPHEAGAPLMSKATTLTELIESNHAFLRSITYHAAEDDAREVSFGELYERALGILYHLQRLGARRGDKLILFLGNNEQFIDVFWAAILGAIIPVPVALGISDEHRPKR